jgi:ABC-type lipoprotein release transport system permease subunit
MKRWLSLLAYAVGALQRRSGKSFALASGLALAVALVAAVLFLTDALRADADRARDAVPDLVVERIVAGRISTMRASDTESLKNPPILAIANIRPRAWGYLFVPALQGNVTVTSSPMSEPELDARAIEEGRDLKSGAHEMVMGRTLAHALGVVVGDQLQLPSPRLAAPPLKLVGTFSSKVDLIAADVIACDENDARALLGLPADEATDLAVTLSNPAEARIVSQTIAARLPGARIVEKDLLSRVYALAYGRRSGIMLAASIPAFLALLLLAWDRASGLGPEEKKEIAILKAVGFATSDVLTTKMLEALVVACTGTAIGLLLGYSWVFWLGAAGLRPAIAGWSAIYPDQALTPMVDATQLFAIAFGVVLPFVALSIIPAWRAATLDPMEAMRG